MNTLMLDIFKESARSAPVPPKTATIKIDDTDYEIEVTQYLPAADKIDLISWVLNLSLDNGTGILSPIRLNIALDLAIVKFYTNIAITEEDMEKPLEVYDALKAHNIFSLVTDLLPVDEYKYIWNMTTDTAYSFERYAFSLAGAMQNMASQTETMDASLTDMMEKIRNKEGLEVLDEIKNIHGN